MPQRFQTKQRLFIYNSLILRDGGERCQSCLKTPAELTKNNSLKPLRLLHLDIDHINENKDDDRLENLQLLCRRCNVRKNRQAQKRHAYSACVRERKEGQPGTRIIRTILDYGNAPVEMQANNLYELPFRQYALEQIATSGGSRKKDIIAGGAEIVGCSPTTTKRYIVKLTSPAGPLMERADALGEVYLVFKPEYGGDKLAETRL